MTMFPVTPVFISCFESYACSYNKCTCISAVFCFVLLIVVCWALQMNSRNQGSGWMQPHKTHGIQVLEYSIMSIVKMIDTFAAI